MSLNLSGQGLAYCMFVNCTERAKKSSFFCFANDCGSYGRLHPTYFMDVHCFSLVIFFLVTLASCTCLSFVSIFLVVFRLSAIYYFKRFVWLSFVVGVKYW